MATTHRGEIQKQTTNLQLSLWQSADAIGAIARAVVVIAAGIHEVT